MCLANIAAPFDNQALPPAIFFEAIVNMNLCKKLQTVAHKNTLTIGYLISLKIVEFGMLKIL